MKTKKNYKEQKYNKKIIFLLGSATTASVMLSGYFSLAAGGSTGAADKNSSLIIIFLLLGLICAIGLLVYALYIKSAQQRYQREHQNDYIYRG